MAYPSLGDSSIPLDLYTDVTNEGLIKVWSQSESGGLAYSMPTPATNEVKFNDYEIDAAVAFLKKYAAAGRLDIVAKTMTRLYQEIALKQDTNAALVLLSALAGAKSKVRGADTTHVIRSNTAGSLVLADFLKMFTLSKRINSAWNGGTPVGGSARGLTDLLVSPEVVENLRGMAYNPLVKGAKTDIPATDKMRDDIYNNAGELSFYGVTIHELNELGIGCKYNAIFDELAGATQFGGAAFDGAASEICIGLDRTKDFLIRPVATDEESGAEVVTLPDDQFPARSGKIGFYTKVRESRVVIDDRPLIGLIV